MPIVKAIITAGGTSRRFGNTNKLFEDLCGKPVIQHSADLFTKMGFEIIIPSHMDFMEDIKILFEKYTNIKVVQGGETRQQSVYKGLLEANGAEYIIIHDGARPLITEDTVKRCLEKAYETKAAIVAVKTTDTIKIVSENNEIISTPDRTKLINVQTPQIFDYKLILDAHKRNKDKSFTDDACLFEAEGKKVYYVDGEYSNIKITNKIDIEYAKLLKNNINKEV